jgi:hypothetical protein
VPPQRHCSGRERTRLLRSPTHATTCARSTYRLDCGPQRCALATAWTDTSGTALGLPQGGSNRDAPGRGVS